MTEAVTKTDPRVQRSRASIIAAVGELVESQPVEQISITRVVEAAGITRPTFYQHFPDVMKAIQAAVFERLEEAFPMPPPVQGLLSDEDLRQRIIDHATPVLTHLAEHPGFYQRVLTSAIGVGFFDQLISFVASRILTTLAAGAERRGEHQRHLSTAIAAGMTWLVIRWVSSGDLTLDSAPILAKEAAVIALALRQT